MISTTDPRIIVLIPAHNEQDSITATIVSLQDQTSPPDDIIVICDNCTDGTARTAVRLGTQVFVTTDNIDMKAGALNQALEKVLPLLDADDLVMVMDADSAVDPCFIATALIELTIRRPRVGAVGGVFYGEPGFGLVGALQRSEYARYGREVARKNAAAFVLTGTATILPVHVLRQVSAARGDTLPGNKGTVYNSSALTEDHELTIAVKTLGWAATSPKQCRVTTEVMPTWNALWHQRLRWQRGAVENLRVYGLTKITRPYIIKQVAMHLGILAVVLFLASMVLFGFLGYLSAPTGLWWALPILFITERVVTVRKQGWRAMLIAAPILIEFAYDIFQQAIYLSAAWNILTRRDATWHHANTPSN